MEAKSLVGVNQKATNLAIYGEFGVKENEFHKEMGSLYLWRIATQLRRPNKIHFHFTSLL